jgi:hypothetical protein
MKMGDIQEKTPKKLILQTRNKRREIKNNIKNVI